MSLIAFTGAGSTGKSTLISECKSYYKDQFIYCDKITRNIQGKGLPINENGSDITQLLIIASHLENSLQPHAILDRCILDGLVYTQYLYKHGKVSKGVVDHAMYVYIMLHDKYDSIFYTEPIKMINDGVRSTNEDFRNETLELFERNLQLDPILNKKVVRLSGSVEQRMKTVISSIDSLTV